VAVASDLQSSIAAARAQSAARRLRPGVGERVPQHLDHLLGLACDGPRGAVDLLTSLSAWSWSGGCSVISGLPSAAAYPASNAALHWRY
jgi:hypothetical protein